MDDVQAEMVAHIARLQFLAMAARAVASVEFESLPEVQRVTVTVNRGAAEHPAELTFYGSDPVPMGEISL